MVPCEPMTVSESVDGKRLGERFQTVLSRSTSIVDVFSLGDGWLPQFPLFQSVLPLHGGAVGHP